MLNPETNAWKASLFSVEAILLNISIDSTA